MRLCVKNGFTLVEVVVAFAIISLAGAVVFSVYKNSALHLQRSQAKQAALLRAQSLIAETGVTRPLKPGRWRGADDSMAWTLSVASYDAAMGQKAAVPAYWVNARVKAGRWQPVELELVTLRLAPEQP